MQIYPPIYTGCMESPPLTSPEKVSLSLLKLLKTHSSTWKHRFLSKKSISPTFLLLEKPLKFVRTVLIKSSPEQSVVRIVYQIKFTTSSKTDQKPVKNVLETFLLMLNVKNVLIIFPIQFHEILQPNQTLNINKIKLTGL